MVEFDNTIWERFAAVAEEAASLGAAEARALLDGVQSPTPTQRHTLRYIRDNYAFDARGDALLAAAAEGRVRLMVS